MTTISQVREYWTCVLLRVVRVPIWQLSWRTQVFVCSFVCLFVRLFVCMLVCLFFGFAMSICLVKCMFFHHLIPVWLVFLVSCENSIIPSCDVVFLRHASLKWCEQRTNESFNSKSSQIRLIYSSLCLFTGYLFYIYNIHVYCLFHTYSIIAFDIFYLLYWNCKCQILID